MSADALADRVQAAIRDAGAAATGITDTAPFPSVRRSLLERRAGGHHAGMSFTFKNPSRSTEPRRLLRGARSLVVAAMGYLEEQPPEPDELAAAVARYAWRDHYARLHDALTAGAEVLRAAGHRAAIVADQNGLVDRAAAHRAGIGWWGRNANLLVPGAGSWFVLGAVVTDAALTTTEDLVEDGCRTCQRCVPACPTGAIVDDGVIDGRRCLAWLVQATGVFPRRHRVALGNRIYGCDDCQDVCPPGRRQPAAARVTIGQREPAEAWVPVLGLLAADDRTLLERHGRWYIPDREVRYLRRNALVVLGNIGDGADAEQRLVVEAHLDHHDPLLRAHAVWTAARLGFRAEAARRHDDPHPWVRAEVALAPAVPPAPGAVAA